MQAGWKAAGLVVLALVVTATWSTTALAIDPTVVVQRYDVYPGSFMPGDVGTVTVTVRNSALATPLAEGSSSQQQSGTQGTSDTHAQTTGGLSGQGSTTNTTSDQSSQSSAQQSTYYYPMDANITRAALYGTPQFSVESPPYEDLGRIGAGDTVTFTFVVRAARDVPDGIYFLVFRLETSDPDVYIGYQLPLKVDGSTVRLILSGQPPAVSADPVDLVFDVVNLRTSGASMVYIEPVSDALSLSPSEYYIGSLDSGEMFTAQLSATSRVTGADVNATFLLHFKNGDNWHEGTPVSLTLKASGAQETSGGAGLLPGLGVILAVLCVAAAYFAYRRARRKR